MNSKKCFFLKKFEALSLRIKVIQKIVYFGKIWYRVFFEFCLVRNINLKNINLNRLLMDDKEF